MNKYWSFLCILITTYILSSLWYVSSSWSHWFLTCTLTTLVLKNVSYTTAEDWKEWRDIIKKLHWKTRKTSCKFQDLRNKKCVDNKHLSKAKATFPSSIWFNKYVFGYYFAFTMTSFPTFCNLIPSASFRSGDESAHFEHSAIKFSGSFSTSSSKKTSLYMQNTSYTL